MMHTRSLLPDYRPRGGRLPPPELVSLLREVDPFAELIYCGAGVWALGVVKESRLHEAKAIRMIRNLTKIQGLAGQGSFIVPKRIKTVISFRLWRYELVRQGFRAITRYTIHGEPGSYVHEDFRMRDFNYRMHFEQHLREIEDAADQDQDEDELMEVFDGYLKGLAKDIHRHATRPPIISIPGKLPAREKVLL